MVRGFLSRDCKSVDVGGVCTWVIFPDRDNIHWVIGKVMDGYGQEVDLRGDYIYVLCLYIALGSLS
jgi:hypothetical protein